MPGNSSPAAIARSNTRVYCGGSGIRIELNEVFLESQFPRSGLVSPLRRLLSFLFPFRSIGADAWKFLRE